MTRTLKLQLAALAAIGIGVSGCVPKVSSPAVPGAQLGNRPVDAALVQRGAEIFYKQGCYMCHGFGTTLRSAPDLAGIMERRDPEWTRRWLLNTTEMLQSDPQAIAMLKDWKGYKMPQIKLRAEDIDPLFHYMANETARVRK